ncbi:kinase-like domain-containing protein [Gigaspora margarita]|uniref:Kinase-like domain-containing protein n=1 Tax=Gigaspora margarita TaxID=4874 RepID=A0A8H4A811_GIGMA|nr:kinase-like domain-containing protein [Gigaspora margarita]
MNTIQARKTGQKNLSLEESSFDIADSTNKSQKQGIECTTIFFYNNKYFTDFLLGDDLSYYSPDEECSDSEESKALTIKHSFLSLKTHYKIDHEFPDPKYRFNLKARGLTTPEKFVAWWNENHHDCQITVDSIKRWTYREDEDPSSYNIHWKEYGED